jgi:hypothetical protein
MEHLGAWGTLINEKNLKSKISCQTPYSAQTVTRIGLLEEIPRSGVQIPCLS